ncbi:uncharacterized protein LOC116984017 [Amblyraja radiata]|uniref:uncharacterized protein LOC116984017 n=1 Tax=Amblyraja radiata TaxID=386614 RepID=UPI0014039F0E|nr:uncharacterized protein LOC116984017 [Amblyraja radiata]
MSELTAEITETITVDPDARETDTEPQTTYSVDELVTHGFVGRYVNINIPGHAKILTLCEVEIFGTEVPYFIGKEGLHLSALNISLAAQCGVSNSTENLAVGALPTQSSTYRKAIAERANDGNRDSDFKHGSCARTMKSKNPWWRVDLKESVNVSDVRITNRADCCGKRLNGAEIRIGNSLSNDGNSNRLCGTVNLVHLMTLVFNCGGLVGKYVNIIIPGHDKRLTLCEVEIFGSKLPSLLGIENVAVGVPAAQSSTYRWASAERANDGNSDSDFRHGSCARTMKSMNPWWRVDLKKSYNVSVVRITNRADCCSAWLQEAEIRIGNSLENDGNVNRLCGTVDSVSGTTLTFNCFGFIGRFVNIIIPGQDKILTLCEVEIVGRELSSSLAKVNLASGAQPIQSSTHRKAGAGRANDGDSDSDFRHGSCTRTRKSKNPWWRVDLKESYNVSVVRITNRADCCKERLQGAEIHIGDSLENDGNSNRLCATVDSVPATTLTFNCDGFIGRYVNIIIPGQDKILTLCDVEVFGSKLPDLYGKSRLKFPLRLWLYAAPQLTLTSLPLKHMSAFLSKPHIDIHTLLDSLGPEQYPNFIMSTNKVLATPENVATEATPTQSSTDQGAGAERANDGNGDSNFRNGSCARTWISNNPWWRVDLKESYNVSDVRITNRADCCSDQLLGAEIRIGDSLENNGNSNRLCVTVDSVAMTTLTFNCAGRVGRYVNIFIPGHDKILTLCEVEIFASKIASIHIPLEEAKKPTYAPETEKQTPIHIPSVKGTKHPPIPGMYIPTEQVAYASPPYQSSTEEGAPPELAHDGNTDSDFSHGSCSRTAKSKSPWWRLDLHESYNVADVRITNRADCCSDQLLGAELRIGDSLENDGNSNRQ